MKLDRDRIVAEAFALLDADGLDNFSLRRLAPRLDVQTPALYWHVGDRAELIGLMAAAIYAEGRRGIAAADWRGWLLALGRGARRAMLASRDGARLCATAEPLRDPPTGAAAIAEPLVSLGLDPATSLSRQGAVIALALGWSLYEQNGGMHDYLATMFDFDASFEQSLAAMVRGFDPPG